MLITSARYARCSTEMVSELDLLKLNCGFRSKAYGSRNQSDIPKFKLSLIDVIKQGCWQGIVTGTSNLEEILSDVKHMSPSTTAMIFVSDTATTISTVNTIPFVAIPNEQINIVDMEISNSKYH